MSDDEDQQVVGIGGDDLPINQSKRKQFGLINNLKKAKSPLQSLYLINKAWWDVFTNLETAELPPKDIDNSPLFNETGEIKDGLKENQDYVTLSTHQVQYLSLWYNYSKPAKVMVDDNLEICLHPLKLSTLNQETFTVPGTSSIKTLKEALCSALEYRPAQTVLWRLPKDCDPAKYNAEEDLFPLLEDDKTLLDCHMESGDYIKIDNESIQKEDAISIAAKIKKELVLGGEKKEEPTEENPNRQNPNRPAHQRMQQTHDEDEEEDEDLDELGGVRRGAGGGGNNPMARMMAGGGIPMNLAMLLGGMMPMRSYEDMEREEIEKAIKASLEIQQREEAEKKKKEEEERKRKEEIDNERKRIQDFAKLEEETKKNEEDYEPIDADNISEDEDDDDDDDDDDDE